MGELMPKFDATPEQLLLYLLMIRNCNKNKSAVVRLFQKKLEKS
jgi:hypothetical protein